MGKKTRFCANCGKETNKLIENICSVCYSETQEIKIPKRLVQKVCPKCDAILLQGLWVKTTRSLEKNLSDKLKKKLILPESEELKEVEIDLKTSRASVKASVLGREFRLDEKLNIDIIKQLCKECRELAIKKHKAKIQLRFKRISKPLIEKALTMTQDHRKFIQKVKEYRNGLDIYLKNLGAASTLARKLSREFHCRMSKSVEQYSWNKTENRPLHRHSILLRQV